MVASLVRFDGFEITVGLLDADGQRVVSGTPSVVHQVLDRSDASVQVTSFRSTLAATRTPPAELRRLGWWG